MADMKGTQGALTSSNANLFTTVLYVEIGTLPFLVGGDLVEKNSHDTGWSRILQLKRDTADLLKKSTVYKVAHHGSINADIEGIWTDLLKEDPLAILSPWTLAGKWLPNANDIKRILSHTPNAFITSPTGDIRPKSRNRAVERSLKEGEILLRVAEKQYGHIRLRWSNGSLALPTVDLFGSAKKLADIRLP